MGHSGCLAGLRRRGLHVDGPRQLNGNRLPRLQAKQLPWQPRNAVHGAHGNGPSVQRHRQQRRDHQLGRDGSARRILGHDHASALPERDGRGIARIHRDGDPASRGRGDIYGGRREPQRGLLRDLDGPGQRGKPAHSLLQLVRHQPDVRHARRCVLAD